jgi:hypothetical protein
MAAPNNAQFGIVFNLSSNITQGTYAIRESTPETTSIGDLVPAPYGQVKLINYNVRHGFNQSHNLHICSTSTGETVLKRPPSPPPVKPTTNNYGNHRQNSSESTTDRSLPRSLPYYEVPSNNRMLISRTRGPTAFDEHVEVALPNIQPPLPPLPHEFGRGDIIRPNSQIDRRGNTTRSQLI